MGGCTLEAAEAVCDADLDLLGSLVDKSLVQQRSGTPGFTQLETLREYALERLDESGEREELARRHAEHFASVVETSEERFQKGEAASQLRLEADLDNLRAALGWCRDSGELELELRLASSLWLFWTVRGHLTEGRRWLDEALARDGELPAGLRASALAATGGLAYRQADYDRSEQVWHEALELFRGLGDAIGTARVTGELGNVAVARGEFERALELYEESARLFRKAGDRRRLANVIGNMGAVANIQLDYGRGRALCEEALAIHRDMGSNEDVALVLHNIARVDLATGRLDDAHRLFHDGLEQAREFGYREIIAYCLEGLGELAAAEDPIRAARLIGASEALFDELGVPIQDQEAESCARTVEALKATLGEAFARARAEGRALEADDAIEEALRPVSQ